MSVAPFRLTRHASARAHQRLDGPLALRGAVRLPKSAFRRLQGWGTSSKKPGQELWCTSSALLLVNRGVVITVTALTVEDLATVLVWLLCDTWT